MSPTQKTLKYLRSKGYACGITEHWNQYAKIRQDLFGFVDIVAIHLSWMPTFVQCTSDSNMAKRIAKIRTLNVAAVILASCSAHIWVIGWKKGHPEPKIVELRENSECVLLDFVRKPRKAKVKKAC